MLCIWFFVLVQWPHQPTGVIKCPSGTLASAKHRPAGNHSPYPCLSDYFDLALSLVKKAE